MLINKVALGPIVTHPRPKNSATIGCIAMTLTELKVRQAFCPPGARPMKCEPHLSAPDEVRRMKQDQENQAFSVWFGTIAAKTAGWVGSAWAFIFLVGCLVPGTSQDPLSPSKRPARSSWRRHWRPSEVPTVGRPGTRTAHAERCFGANHYLD